MSGVTDERSGLRVEDVVYREHNKSICANVNEITAGLLNHVKVV